MKLPIESFDKYRYQCKECRRKYKKEKYKTNMINQGNSKNGIGEVKTASGTSGGLPDWSKDYSISMSPLTYEELLRKQIWYDEPKTHGNRKQWVEPVSTRLFIIFWSCIDCSQLLVKLMVNFGNPRRY
jgi:hypothetical protein